MYVWLWDLCALCSGVWDVPGHDRNTESVSESQRDCIDTVESRETHAHDTHASEPNLSLSVPFPLVIT